jgi:hypothetical protein
VLQKRGVDGFAVCGIFGSLVGLKVCVITHKICLLVKVLRLMSPSYTPPRENWMILLL